MTTQEFEVSIDETLFKGDYAEIKPEICHVLERIGEGFGWSVKELKSDTIVFRTPISFRSFGETVIVNFSSRRLRINSTTNQKTVLTSWGKNKDNCIRFLNEVIPAVSEYLKGKEQERHVSNLEFVEVIRKGLSEISVDKSIIEKLLANQNVFDRTLIPNLMKINSYYESQVKIHNILYHNINSVDFHTLSDTEIEHTVQSVRTYTTGIKLLEIIIHETLDSLINGKLIQFYSLYNKFEELGIFLSKADKLIINGIRDINENLSGVLRSIGDLNSLVRGLTSQMSDIDDKMYYSNLLQTFNAYNIYKLRTK